MECDREGELKGGGAKGLLGKLLRLMCKCYGSGVGEIIIPLRSNLLLLVLDTCSSKMSTSF